MGDAQPGGWPEWLGGVAMCAPLIVGALVAGDQSTVAHLAAVGVIVTALLIEALVAPLAGYRRRDVLWSLLPVWGWVIAWQLGTHLARRSRANSGPLSEASARVSR